jgi:hypothetical protein
VLIRIRGNCRTKLELEVVRRVNILNSQRKAYLRGIWPRVDIALCMDSAYMRCYILCRWQNILALCILDGHVRLKGVCSEAGRLYFPCHLSNSLRVRGSGLLLLSLYLFSVHATFITKGKIGTMAKDHHERCGFTPAAPCLDSAYM